MAHRRIDLPWLPPAPADFSARCRALRDGHAAGADFQFLAGHRLTAVQAASFRRSFERWLASGGSLAPLSRFKLAILSNATIDFIADEIPAGAARHGIAIELVLPDFDQVMQQVLDPASQTNASRPDAVLLALDYRWLGLSSFAGAAAATQLSAAKERLFAAADAVRRNSGAAVILASLAAPPQPVFGSFDLRVEGALEAMIADINGAIVDYCARTGTYLLDVAGLARQIGTDHWFDPVQWAAFKLPFASECNAAFADLLGRLLGSLRGRARKCLVLDLDNTLWGGVIGDDGLEGIKLGSGSALGEAFLNVQQTAKTLRDRGIILAVSSKNDDAVARAAFRDHPEMVLREGDIAVFQANWTDKASNLEAIARALDIGVDALVMLDDNPAERAQLRAALPAVAVPELPDDPAWFSWYLLAAGYFEAVSFSKEDELRAASYAANAKRAEVQASARSLGDYLVSLETHLAVRRFDRNGRARLAQLINKTNQFNLTTRRLTELQVQEIEQDGDWIALQCRLTDRFGDMGTIGIITARRSGDAMEVEDWVMSCRVLGRKVEEAMCAALVAEARGRGVRVIRARYVPTTKNGMVKEHFDRLGFPLVQEDMDGTRRYSVGVDSFPVPDLPLTLDHRMPDRGKSVVPAPFVDRQGPAKAPGETDAGSALIASQSQAGRNFRFVAHPEESPLRILNMGSCGIHNPQLVLNKAGRVPYLWSKFGFKRTPYALSSGATLQLFDFCTGERQLPLETRLLTYLDPNQPTAETREALFETDVILVEMSTPIEYLLDGAIVNINRIGECVFKPLRDLMDRKVVNQWASALLQGDEAKRKPATDALLAKMPKDADKSIVSLVNELRTRRVGVDDMVRDLSALRERLPRPMGLVLFDFRYMPDGRAIEWPAGFKTEQAEVARRLDLPTLDFAPIVEKLGTAATMRPDLSHWQEEAYPLQAEMIYDFAAARVGRLPMAQLPRRIAVRGSATSWQMDKHERAEIAKIPARLAAELKAIHAPRLAELGVDGSGLHQHYERLLAQNAVFGRREEHAVLLLIEHLPQFDHYAVMQAGLGQLALALGMAGKRVTAYEFFTKRRAAIAAGIEHFVALGLLEPGQVTLADDFPVRGDRDGSVVAIACEFALQLDEEGKNKILRDLGELDGLLIQPVNFLGAHAPKDQKAMVFDRLAAVGLDHAASFPPTGFTYFSH